MHTHTYTLRPLSAFLRARGYLPGQRVGGSTNLLFVPLHALE